MTDTTAWTERVDPAEAAHLARLQAAEQAAKGATSGFGAFLADKYGVAQSDIFRVAFEIVRAKKEDVKMDEQSVKKVQKRTR
jgi:hypothetical protein